MSHSRGATRDRFIREAEETAARERSIQSKIDAKEQGASPGTSEKPKPMPAGAREYPTPPMPKQHMAKPGSEAALELQPR
jgi:hypothetical protein